MCDEKKKEVGPSYWIPHGERVVEPKVVLEGQQQGPMAEHLESGNNTGVRDEEGGHCEEVEVLPIARVPSN
jgi:hypothetical protein